MRWIPRRFGYRLALAYVSVFVLVSIVTAFWVTQRLQESSLRQLQSSLVKDAETLDLFLPRQELHEEKIETLQALARTYSQNTGTRVSILNTSGRLLADSSRKVEELRGLKSRLDRPEIQIALDGAVGTHIRYSPEDKSDFVHVTLPLRDDKVLLGVLRLSLPLSAAQSAFGALNRPVLYGATAGILGILLAGFVLGRSAAGQIDHLIESARDYAAGKLARRIHVKEDSDLRDLADAMNHMARSLKSRLAEVEAERNKTSSILENMDEGVIAVDAFRNVLFINASVRQILDLGRSASLGESLLGMVRNSDVDELAVKVLESGGSAVCDIDLLGEVERKIRVKAVCVNGGEISPAAVIFFYDVTEMTRLESLRRDFVANVSHELRTPLTTIKGFVETLLHGAIEDKEKSRSFLKIMQEDSDRLQRLIDDLLEFSKLENRDLPFNFSALTLRDEAQKSLDIFSSRMEEASLRGRLIAEPGAPSRVWADPDKLRQVLVNLIDNAIKFNREDGEVVVRLSGQSGMVRVSVEDTGAGIPEKALPRLFERFFRVDKARSRELGGTGLGLAIVKHIVDRHGGRVWCESSPGTGSRFIFTLPLPPSSGSYA